MESLASKKTYKFAVRIVKLYKHFTINLKEFTLSKQILKSGTSIAANTREAYNAQSDLDFISKFSIAQKECSETLFWIDLLFDSEYLSKKQHESLKNDCAQIYKIITSIILTKKQNLKKESKLRTS
jgi:four helix bundle protein